MPTVTGATTAGTAPSPGASGIGIRLLDVPAATQTDPRARSYIVDRLPPGTTIKRRIQVQNNSSTAQTVRVYTGAAHISDGSFVGEADPSANPLTTWTTVDQSHISLTPGITANLTVSIAVPQDAPEGEQYAAVWAETRAAASGTQVVQASRVGIRVYLSVGEGNGKPADFSITALTAGRDENNRPQLSADVTNTGGRALDISGDLSLTGGPSGLSAGPFALNQTTTIAPGETRAVAVAMDPQLPNGPWEAKLRLKSGLVEHVAAAPITFPDVGRQAVTAPVRSVGMVWPAIGLAALGALLLAALAWWLRNRKTAVRRAGRLG
jgi:hypothetical protein